MSCSENLSGSHQCSPTVHIDVPSNDGDSGEKAVIAESAYVPDSRREYVKNSIRRTANSVRSNYILRSYAKSNKVSSSKEETELKDEKTSSHNSLYANVRNGKKRNMRKRRKIVKEDEYARIRRKLRYILGKMGYEKNLISAYSGEGWKGLRLERLKPDMELKRATSEIFRCKMRIRDIFQRIDSLCAKGKLPEQLFDSEGQIDSEDIFCAKCGSKDSILDNDIILCDGMCDRAFHQLCLSPPLLKNDIPPDDEGWLCPGCDCKADCVHLLNETSGTDISIHDNWEKIFPEAASVQNADQAEVFSSDDSEDKHPEPTFLHTLDKDVDSKWNIDQLLALPSDDSEDYDYDPTMHPSCPAPEDASSSDFSSDSDDLAPYCDKNLNPEKLIPDRSAFPPGEIRNLHSYDQVLSLPSEDSEDDDYNPADNGGASRSGSSTDLEDHDVVCLGNGTADEEVTCSPAVNWTNDAKSTPSEEKIPCLSTVTFSVSTPHPSEDGFQLSEKTGEGCDVTKLDDVSTETLKNISPELDNKETCSTETRKEHEETPSLASGRFSLTPFDTVTNGMPHSFTPTPKKKLSSSSIERRAKLHDSTSRMDMNLRSRKMSSSSSDVKKAINSHSRQRLGADANKKLQDVFKEDQYPIKSTRERLANETGLSFLQVSRWFANNRYFSRNAASQGEQCTPTAPLPKR